MGNVRWMAGVVCLLAGTSSAWAQVDINPTGPTCVAEDASTSTYTATVTTNYNFDFRLKVYLNGILKHDSTTVVVQSGPTYNFSKVVSHSGWSMIDGDTLDYVGRATITSGEYTGVYKQKTLVLTVCPPGGCFLPRRADSLPKLEGIREPLYREEMNG